MKKVLFLNLTAFSQTGGIEKFNKCFLKALNELDEERVTDSYSYSAYDTVCDEKYYNARKYKGFGKNKLSFVINSIIKAIRYDIVVLGHINIAVIGTILKTLFPKKKLILVTHGIEVWTPLDGAKKKVLQLADKILSVSSYTQNKLMELHKIGKQKIHVFPNTIDPYFDIPEGTERQEWLRDRYGIKKDQFLLYTLTRLSSNEQYKGYDKVIIALSEVVKQYPGVRYIIAGKYDEKEKELVDVLVDKHGLNDNVRLIGYIDEKELVAHYQMADLYIMPSKNEGFGIVFIEALVSGVPVIGGNCDGSTDALLGGKTGTLVNPDDIAGITNAIIKNVTLNLRNDKVNSERLRSLTLGNFSFERYKLRLSNIIAEC